MKKKAKELTKGKKEEKTYSADIVRNHIDMYSEMLHLTYNCHIIILPSTRKRFEDTIKRVEKEFLKEFKSGGFYHYLNEMKKTLKR